MSKDFTAHPSKYPQGYFKDKPCKMCGEEFSPIAPSHLTCSDKCKKDLSSHRYLKRTYGISFSEYEELHRKCGSKCEICGSVGFNINPNTDMLLNVDHCHETGKVRGLLCPNCNRALGLLKDNIDSLKKAIEYLEGATTIP